MGDDDAGKAGRISKAEPGEHGHDVAVVNPVSCIDHDHVVTGPDNKDIPPAGGLETEQRCRFIQGEFLHIRVKRFAARGIHCPAGCKHALEHFARVAAAVRQFLGNMIGIGKEREDETVFGLADQFADCLAVPDIEDGIVQTLAGCIVLQDIQPVPGLQLVEQLVNFRILLKVEADREPVRCRPRSSKSIYAILARADVV